MAQRGLGLGRIRLTRPQVAWLIPSSLAAKACYDELRGVLIVADESLSREEVKTFATLSQRKTTAGPSRNTGSESGRWGGGQTARPVRPPDARAASCGGTGGPLVAAGTEELGLLCLESG